jgi:hypothetical protein
MSKNSNLKYLHYLMHKRFRLPAKLLICLLCFNFLVLNSHHVICLELTSEGICKAHLQSHHCLNPENNESGTSLHSHNSRTSHAVHLHLASKAQSCPECIDGHIESLHSSPESNLFASSHFEDISLIIQTKINQRLYADLTPSVTREHRLPLSSFRSSVIRSTIMLI